MENYIGRLLDNRYEILEVIGTGGMAVVYKARCHRLNRLVAIKILKDELSQDAEFRRRFHAESQAVAMLSHPNIVNVYDVSRSDNVDYIVMELIDGITLKQYMEQKGTLNWREVLHFSTQIAKALEHAHSRGIIHRDIKPHNIMILKDGSVKVADFGIARVSSAQSTLTREALGSVHYISPEQAKGGKIDYRSDLYSLGVVMYEMLTGRPPYDGETPVSVAIQHINAHAVRPRDWNPQIPVGLEQITMHAMAADLDQRYENATEMLSDLEEFRRNPSVNFDFSGAPAAPYQEARTGPRTAAERAAKVRAEAPRRQPPEQPHRKKNNAAALVAGVIGIALVLLGIGYFLYSFFLQDLFNTPADVEVPNFVYQFLEEIDESRYPDFKIQVEEWVNDESMEQGRVLRQKPDSGRMVKSGTTVYLTVSLGPATDAMRDLVGYTEENARTILDNLALNLNVQVLRENSDAVASGSVIRTDPVKDSILKEGQTVTLVVSDGPEVKLTEVPDLLDLKVDVALDRLDARNLVGDVSYVDDDAEKDTVIFQSIRKDEKVKEGTVIKLQVSNGPAEEPDDVNPDEDPDNDPNEGGVPGLAQEWVIYVPTPENAATTFEVAVKVDGVMNQPLFEVDPETVVNNQIPIAVKGYGIHPIDVYFDGVLSWSVFYDFDKGEIVEP